jgi:hypothetical protein
MNTFDRHVDPELYEQISNREDFELTEVHSSASPGGTHADLGESHNGLFYVRTYTTNEFADFEPGKRHVEKAYVFQSDEYHLALKFYNAIVEADEDRYERIEDLKAQLLAEAKHFVNSDTIGEKVIDPIDGDRLARPYLWTNVYRDAGQLPEPDGYYESILALETYSERAATSINQAVAGL